MGQCDWWCSWSTGVSISDQSASFKAVLTEQKAFIHSSVWSLSVSIFIYLFTCCRSSKSWLNPLQILIRRAVSFISALMNCWTALQAELERERSTAGVEVEAKSSLCLICIADPTDRRQMRAQRASLKPPPGVFITASQYQQPTASPHYPRMHTQASHRELSRTEDLHE